MKSISRHRTFGLRAEWVQIYFDDTENFWTNGRLGVKMYDAFKSWGQDCGLLDGKKNPSPHFEKMLALGVSNPKLWGLFWVNLAYNAPVVNIFVRNVQFDFPYDNIFLMKMLGDNHSENTKRAALQALKNTFRASPIGEKLRQGICKMNGNQVLSITRLSWENPEPLVILYCLYQFAALSDELYSFTLTELMNDDAKRNALSPQILFGLDVKTLRPLIQGLANNYPEFIKVDFNKDIMENIFLKKNLTADDVIELF